MTTMTSQITSLTVVYSTVYSDAVQRKHQSSASLSFVWGIHRDRWIPRTKGQLRGKCFHLMASSWSGTSPSDVEAIAAATVHASVVIASTTTAVEVKMCGVYLSDNQLQSNVYIYTDKFTLISIKVRVIRQHSRFETPVITVGTIWASRTSHVRQLLLILWNACSLTRPIYCWENRCRRKEMNRKWFNDETNKLSLPYHYRGLTHWGRDIMDAISQTAFFKCISFNKNVWFQIKILPMFVPKGPITNIPALVETMAWRCPGDNSLFETMVVIYRRICVARKANQFFSLSEICMSSVPGWQ